jgi:phenol hydroxylase P1 protein
VQIDIKTASVRPLRQTFSFIARRLGADKPASRYQEATIDMQPEANFHYRPLWQPEYELYDKRRTAIVMADWYGFKDPRQFYYGTYAMVRARQQETMEKSLEFADKRELLQKLPEEVRSRIAAVMLPLRHYEWGANMNNCYCTAYGYGAAITQATQFATMDRLGLAQYVSRIGLLLDGNQGLSLAKAKEDWLNASTWQGVRRQLENVFVTKDWFEVFVAQNLVFDGLIYPLVYRKFDERICDEAGSAFSTTTEFMREWFDESSRWVDATIKTAADESAANKEILNAWVSKWSGEFIAAITPLAAAAFGDDHQEELAQLSAAFHARVAKLGLSA